MGPSTSDSSSKPIKKGQLFCIISSIKSSSPSIKVYGKVCKFSPNSLPGVKKDLSTMYQWAMNNQIDYKGQLQFGAELLNQKNKKDLMSSLKKFFENSCTYEVTYLYYSGHGDREGNWALQTSKGIEFVSPNDVFHQWAKCFPSKQKRTLQIILDQCFAGKWFEEIFPPNCKQTDFLWNLRLTYTRKQSEQQAINQQYQTKVIIRASCKAQEQSNDWGLSKGGAFTCTRYGNQNQALNASQNPQMRVFLIQYRKITPQQFALEQGMQKLRELESRDYGGGSHDLFKY